MPWSCCWKSWCPALSRVGVEADELAAGGAKPLAVVTVVPVVSWAFFACSDLLRPG